MNLTDTVLNDFRKRMNGIVVPETEWKRFTAKLTLERLHQDQFLSLEGEPADKIAFIESGIFRAFYTSDSGDEKTIVFRSTGTIISAYNPFVQNSTSRFSLQALEDSSFFVLTVNDFRQLLKEHEVWQIIAGQYYMNIYAEKEKREKSLLTDDAETRYRQFLQEYPGYINRLKHYHIASYLGISNVSLSRIRKKIQKEYYESTKV